MQQLKFVRSKLVESSECLKNLTPEAEGQTMLAPLTASVSFIVFNMIINSLSAR